MKYQHIVTVAVCAAIVGCTPRTHDIQSSYVSPKEYSNYTCDELSAERHRIVTEAKKIGDLQEENADADAAFVAGFLLVSMPLLVGTALTKNRAKEFAALKGKYEAVDEMQYEKRCDVGDGIRAQGFYTKPPKGEPQLKPTGK